VRSLFFTLPRILKGVDRHACCARHGSGRRSLADLHFASPWRATPIASNWGFIDNMIALTFWITGAGFVAVVLFMAYCLYRFRHQPGRRAAYEPENQKLEAWLAVITTIAVVVLLAPGLLVWGQYISVPQGAMEVEAVGVQWSWSFRLPGADNKLGSTDVRFVDGNNSLGVNPADPRVGTISLSQMANCICPSAGR